MDLNFYKGKRILVTGHTGFKGTWMCKVLLQQGADVIGYALRPSLDRNLFDLSGVKKHITSIYGDIRDIDRLEKVFKEYKPEIVIHMAAQPIVRESYQNPRYTYETNVMGTVNIMEMLRLNDNILSFVNVTTDKVYQNNEWFWGYRETDQLDGFDPYSNSKSCSELVTHSYKRSFFKNKKIAISTCRAGNVIGGGDFSKDRIIPDCIRAVEENKKIKVRNPYSIRPYQHVLEPVCAYLKLAELQYSNKNKYEGSYNIGPDESDCITTGDLVELFCKYWGENAEWESIQLENPPHEAGFLKLDCSKIKSVMGWNPKWSVKDAVKYTVEWSKVLLQKENIIECMENQIDLYLR